MKIKLFKLINNERINKKLISAKACGDGTAVDECGQQDNAHCTLYAYDVCTVEDYAGCTKGADDTCDYDYTACSGPSSFDKA